MNMFLKQEVSYYQSCGKSFAHTLSTIILCVIQKK